MNAKSYIEFHDKFTKKNKFEFSHGIQLFRDFVRKIPVNNSLLKEFIVLARAEPEIKIVLNYLLERNKGSYITTAAIKLLQEKILN